MVKIIVGKKGTGKTKILIENINNVAKSSKGHVVCVDNCDKLKFDIDHSVRLVDVNEFAIEGADKFYGLLAGLLAGNYDICEIFVDSVLKIIGRDFAVLAKLLAAVEKISGQTEVFFTVSADESELPEEVKKYL